MKCSFQSAAVGSGAMRHGASGGYWSAAITAYDHLWQADGCNWAAGTGAATVTAHRELYRVRQRERVRLNLLLLLSLAIRMLLIYVRLGHCRDRRCGHWGFIAIYVRNNCDNHSDSMPTWSWTRCWHLTMMITMIMMMMWVCAFFVIVIVWLYESNCSN